MKPYDVEAAKADVAAESERVACSAKAAIERAGYEAIHKLEVQAAAFAVMPRDLSALFTQASYVEIRELRREGFPGGSKFHVDAQIVANGYPTCFTVDLPSKPHRLIAFFVPIEE